MSIFLQSSPLFVSVCERELPREFDIHMFLYCSLDIVDEKVDGANRSQELYLGPLIADQKFKVAVVYLFIHVRHFLEYARCRLLFSAKRKSNLVFNM